MTLHYAFEHIELDGGTSLGEFSMMITSLMNTNGRKTTANTLNNISKTDGAEDNSTINSI